MRKTILIMLMALAGLTGRAQQNALTLNEALQSAENNYPSLKQKQLLTNIGKENENLINASLIPQVNVAGQGTYQSEITSFELPDLPPIGQKKDNYNIGLEMRFPITQFGTVATRRQLEQARTTASVTQIDLDLQRIRERITALFGNVLLLKENENILRIRIADLDSETRKVAVSVASGAVLKSNQLVLESELLSTRQRIDDAAGTMKGLTDELSILTGLHVDTTTLFRLENLTEMHTQQINRPELKLYEAQKSVLNVQSTLIKKEARPDLYIFGQGYYGRPGYNFINTNMRLYGLGGVGLSWNLNNFFNQGKQQRIVEINKQVVNTQEETFMQNLNAALAEKNAEIEKYQNIITKDEQIVKNRQEIIRAASSQLQNGVITSTDYLTELNALTTAQLNFTLHQVQLAVSKVQYNILLGY